MTSSQSHLSPEDSAAIDAELRPFGGETIPLGRPSPTVHALPTVAPDVAPPETLIAPEEKPQISQEPLPQSESPSIDSALIVSFSPLPDGSFGTSLSLELKCQSPNARIFYALGTSHVDQDGMIYNPQEPILLTQTTLVAARAATDSELGPVQHARFEINKPTWQEVEPQDQSDPAPHKASEHRLNDDGWHIAAGSVRGKLHAHRGSWREDSFALDQVEAADGAWLVAVASDGAGSASLSRVGSSVACSAAMSSLRASLGAIATLSSDQPSLVTHDLPALCQALIQAGTDALSAIQDQAHTRGKPLTAFAATLLILVRRSWNESQLCAALQVGDGSIALWDGKTVTLLGEPDHGQNSGETRFLTTMGIENELPARIKFSIKSHLEGFAVMTDGVSDDYFPEETRLGELFAALLPTVQRAEDAGATLVSWLGYEKRGSSDDRTLIIGWPGQPIPMEATRGV